MKDLIVSVADGCQEKVMEALLPRVPRCSGTETFTFEIIRNILCDSGSYNGSHELLRPFIRDFRYSLVILDFEGSGVEGIKTREETEQDIETLLCKNGWAGRNAAIVVNPEIETWMWIDSIHVGNAIGWERSESLYEWARSSGILGVDTYKPLRAKESFRLALKESNTSFSSSIYKKIASRVSYRSCNDPAFLKLISTLQRWFR